MNDTKMTDLMIDIETLDISNTAIIVSLAAVEFNPISAFMNKEFYEIVNLDSYKDYQQHFSFSFNTMLWWFNQEKESQNIFSFENQKKANPIYMVLRNFIRAFDFKDYERIWSKGNFDFPIIENAMNALVDECSMPWHYSQLCDMRTVLKLSGLKFEHNTHNALDDCYSQINQLVEALKAIKGNR